MLLIVALTAVFIAARCSELEEWDLFKAFHKKTYPTLKHESYRRNIFKENLMLARKHNFEANVGLHTWYMGINHLSDMTADEVATTMTGLRESNDHEKLQENEDSSAMELERTDIPDAINWVEKGCVTSIRNQGHCGSCYVFSVTGALEGQYKLLTGNLMKFSEQSIMDCTVNKSCDACEGPSLGCGGGYRYTTFKVENRYHGAMLEKDRPYKAKDEECAFEPSKAVRFQIRGIQRIQEKSEEALKVACGTKGPISVCLNVGGKGFHQYKSGVYNDPNCPKKLTHAVLLVGYGRQDEEDYWLVKNSWGTGWGEEGYLKIARNQNNMCGISSSPFYPVLEQFP